MDILFPSEIVRRKKPNYCTQHDYYSCGPTAILNALKWVGVRDATMKKSHRFLCDFCFTSTGEGGGTFPQEIDRVLRILAGTHPFSVLRLKNMGIKSVTQHLMHPDKSLIINYYRHYSFWPTTDGKWYFGVNDHRAHGNDSKMIRVAAVTRKHFRRYCLRKSYPDWRPNHYHYPQIWVITRHE